MVHSLYQISKPGWNTEISSCVKYGKSCRIHKAVVKCIILNLIQIYKVIEPCLADLYMCIIDAL